jgi:protoheme IX farnesyltransferase
MWRDIAVIAKPGITVSNALMTLGGLALAGRADSRTALFALLGTALTVASAGALNMLLERERDALMERTAARPLVSGSISPGTCALLGIAWGTAGLLMLALFVNPLTAWLGALAHVTYVCIYTPLKYKSWTSVYAGSVAGAMPPLMGWTAATGSIDAPGIALFGILFLWQIPHVLAIGVFRRHEYARAGIQTFAHTFGNRPAVIHAALVCSVLVAAALLPLRLGQAGVAYLVLSALAGAAYLAGAIRACMAPEKRARALFFASLGYLPAIALGLALK